MCCCSFECCFSFIQNRSDTVYRLCLSICVSDDISSTFNSIGAFRIVLFSTSSQDSPLFNDYQTFFPTLISVESVFLHPAFCIVVFFQSVSVQVQNNDEFRIHHVHQNTVVYSVAMVLSLQAVQGLIYVGATMLLI